MAIKTLLSSIQMLEKLISFATVSHNSNLELMQFVQDYLKQFHIQSHLVYNEEKTKANLYALIGDAVEGGIILSGHTDVVPVEGQNWSSNPFTLVEKNNAYYGRGTCDMKSFVAICLSLVPKMLEKPLKKPFILAFSYDEEVGCKGVQSMIDEIAIKLPRPEMVIVGEPTNMQVITAHKNVCSFWTEVTGAEKHSSQVHNAVSAVMVAARMITKLEDMMLISSTHNYSDFYFEPNYNTFHVGKIEGGTAHNIVAKHCKFVTDIRSIPSIDPSLPFQQFKDWALNELLPPLKLKEPNANIEFTINSSMQGLSPEKNNPIETIARQLTGDNATHMASYAAEAGFFQKAGYKTILCGPGSIDQAHQPDEFITQKQFALGVEFIEKLIEKMQQ